LTVRLSIHKGCNLGIGGVPFKAKDNNVSVDRLYNISQRKEQEPSPIIRSYPIYIRYLFDSQVKNQYIKAANRTFFFPYQFGLFVPGDVIDHPAVTNCTSDSLSQKESVWALYCTSMLLWNFCNRFRKPREDDEQAEQANEAFLCSFYKSECLSVSSPQTSMLLTFLAIISPIFEANQTSAMLTSVHV